MMSSVAGSCIGFAILEIEQRRIRPLMPEICRFRRSVGWLPAVVGEAVMSRSQIDVGSFQCSNQVGGRK